MTPQQQYDFFFNLKMKTVFEVEFVEHPQTAAELLKFN